MIKAIAFDFFGVICADVAGIWYKNHNPAMSYEELKEKYLRFLDGGMVPGEQTWRALADAVHTPVEQLKSDWLALANLNQETVELIRNLRQRYTVAVCTNADAGFFWSIMDKANIRDLFSVIVVSSEEKTVKPSLEIFQVLLNKLALSPGEVLFTDDTPRNIAGAEAMGIQGIPFTTASELKKALLERGLMN